MLELRQKPFCEPIRQEQLDISEKKRSNVFTWRGQFSPQLIEELISNYCPDDAVVLDPFVGSGTVLYEAARFGLEAIGFELNPAAFILSKTYHLVNDRNREKMLRSLHQKLAKTFPQQALFDEPEVLDFGCLKEKFNSLLRICQPSERIVVEALVILLDLANTRITSEVIFQRFFRLRDTIVSWPKSQKPISAKLGDARALPLEDRSIDFIVTSPPYINVFNYHQNYRRSAELLGWDLLEIARSEIGSNRANRGNRFLTVIQYCLDIGCVLEELRRVLNDQGKMIMVVGHESSVLGVPFFNGEAIRRIALESGIFDIPLVQRRKFTNKFGKIIWEDVIHFNCGSRMNASTEPIAKQVSLNMLEGGLEVCPEKNTDLLQSAIEKTSILQGSPILNGQEMAC